MTHPLTDEIGDALHIVDVNGTTYATDTYWMAPVPADVIGLLRWWNLEPTPGRYEFDYLDDYADYCDECGQESGRGPLRSRGKAVEAQQLANIMKKLAGDPLQRVRTGDGQTLYAINTTTKKPVAVFTGTDSDGDAFCVYANPEYLRLAFGGNWATDDIELRCPDPRSPIWAKSATGDIACVMPVRL